MRCSATLVLLAEAACLLAPAATPARVSSTPRCHTINLRVRDGGQSAGAGSTFRLFVIRNITRHSCHTRGLAGLQLLDGDKRNVCTRVAGDGSKSWRVTLRPGGLAHFATEYRGTTRTGGSCHVPVARYVRVIPPDETAYRLVRLHGRGIVSCDGRFSEQPLRRGHDNSTT